ncbi:MAG: DUF4410 domain-containing protein [Acidobacteriaceae bacterium]|nr:DUF4410 domain-containing protein [Acidobacteriaceae bacterium]
MRVRVGSLLVCSLLSVAGSASAPTQACAQESGRQQGVTVSTPGPGEGQANARKSVAILRFAVQLQPIENTSSLSEKACPQSVSTQPVSTPSDASAGNASPQASAVDPVLLDKISEEMKNKLSKKMDVQVNPDLQSLPVGVIALGGCIVRASGGNSAERLVGMGLGSSHLDVHVVVVSRTESGWSPVDSFDLHVKGGNLLPPLGPIGFAVHAAKDTQQTLSADARKLADKILKQLANDLKEKEQTANKG